ncbi:hypothetical protein P171DRAFT_448594 [Karstenula rhodostoma CBS 690.94]|uniref:Uncharacterized protein n=1 Tax=Karstenula rhodostoma CBS 690.94 TaxID=1392251 RepID=A0A9P4U6S5_9PLEO|nr:hypothetical protein P171DRAFT_448594 [Karstenula rhodostoma CBS 690.94]
MHIHRSPSQEYPHHRGHSSPPRHLQRRASHRNGSSLPNNRTLRSRHSIAALRRATYFTTESTILESIPMDQDPSFPPLSFSLLAAPGPSPTTATEVQLCRPPHPARAPCGEKQVEVNPKPPESTMRRSDSDIHETAPSPPSTSPHSLRPTSISRRRSEDQLLPPLQISKARPSIAIYLLPGIPPTPEAMLHPLSNPFTLLCADCHTPRPHILIGQATAVCRTCLTAFKSADRMRKSPQRRGSVLTSFPPLLAVESPGGEDEDTNAEVEAATRKLSIVEGITRVFGMLRGGAGKSRRGSESSVESWRGSGCGASGRSASRSSFTYSTSSQD